MHSEACKKDIPVIDVPSGTVASDKADGFNARVITNSIYCWNRPVYDIKDTWGEAGPLTKLSDDHGCTRVTL
jgi:hypothetical protein